MAKAKVGKKKAVRDLPVENVSDVKGGTFNKVVENSVSSIRKSLGTQN